jgi:hypothetical protein
MYRTANTLPEQIRSRSMALLNRHPPPPSTCTRKSNRRTGTSAVQHSSQSTSCSTRSPMASKSTRTRSPNVRAPSAAPPKGPSKRRRSARSSDRTGWVSPTRRHILQRSRQRWRASASRSAMRSTTAMSSAISTSRTCSPRSRAAPTNSSGSSSRIGSRSALSVTLAGLRCPLSVRPPKSGVRSEATNHEPAGIQEPQR